MSIRTNRSVDPNVDLLPQTWSDNSTREAAGTWFSNAAALTTDAWRAIPERFAPGFGDERAPANVIAHDRAPVPKKFLRPGNTPAAIPRAELPTVETGVPGFIKPPPDPQWLQQPEDPFKAIHGELPWRFITDPAFDPQAPASAPGYISKPSADPQWLQQREDLLDAIRGGSQEGFMTIPGFGLQAPETAPGYTGEPPADPQWLQQREDALQAIRSDYEAARDQAQALPGSAPGWKIAVLDTDQNGQPVSPVSDASHVYISDGSTTVWDESGPHEVATGHWLEFDETAFAQSYQAQAGAPLQALAALYGTDPASLLAEHPELWGIAIA